MTFPKGIIQYSNIKKLFNMFVFFKKIHYLCPGSKNKSVLKYGGEQTQGESPAGRPFYIKKIGRVTADEPSIFLWLLSWCFNDITKVNIYIGISK
jgi:hypothetical protein